MRIRMLLLALVLLTAVDLAAAQERTYVLQDVAAPPCAREGEVVELGCGLTQCIGYGLPGTWADEIQYVFDLPAAPQGGPWLVESVAFFMSGTSEHRVILRQPGSDAAAPPGIEVGTDNAVRFIPAYATWPPADWTYITLAGAFPPYPYDGQLIVASGGSLCIGIQLLSGDAIGLANSGTATGRAWSTWGGGWQQDDAALAIYPAARIGLVDLGSSGTETQNWGNIKSLFKETR